MPPGSPVEYFDTLPIAYVDRPDDRLLVIGATLVAAATVGGQFVADETIVLLGASNSISIGPTRNATDN